MIRFVLPVLLAASLGVGLTPVAAQNVEAVTSDKAGLSAVDMFQEAERAKAENRSRDALAIYDALSHDPDLEIRTEARFRRGLQFVSEKHYSRAAVAFREILDEKPDAARVRLELANVLALMGDEDGARRQLLRTRAGALPPNVALVVDQFASALRSTKRFGGSIELAFAPDSNVNRATAARTLDTVIAPLQLSDDARATTGLGARLNGQAYVRIPVAGAVSLLARSSIGATVYSKDEFNDISWSAAAGPDVRIGTNRLQPSFGYSRRYYGGRAYAKTWSGGMEWRRNIGRRSQLNAQASASAARYDVNASQNGSIYDGSLTIERNFTPRFGGSVSMMFNRQTARDPGYATAAGGGTLLLYADLGKSTVFGTVAYQHLEADARLLLFRERRRDDYVRLSGGITLRQLKLYGFAPIIRGTFERNNSTTKIYDYRRFSMSVGVTRAF